MKTKVLKDVCQTLLGRAGVPIGWLDEQANFVYVNRALTDLLGCSEAECLEISLNDIDVNFSAEAFRTKWESLKFSEVAQKDESEFRLKAGRLMPVEITSHHFIANGHEYLAVFIRDISVRKQAEESLCESEARLKLILQELPCYLWTTDTSLRYTYLAGSSSATAKQRVNEIIGRESIYPAIAGAHRKALSGIASSFEFKAPTDGKTYLMRIEPWRDASGNRMGALGLSIDITKRKEIEDALRESQKRLKDTATAYVKAQEEEREWTAIEIHDRVVQCLTAASHKAQRLKPSVSGDSGQALLKELSNDLKEVLQETRTIMSELYPTTLERYGLIKLIGWDLNSLEAASGATTELRNELKVQPHGAVETTLYRITHEAILNIKKHAKTASKVNILLKEWRNWIRLEITDDGPGFTLTKSNWGHGGLDSMRRRAEIIGGTFNIKSKPGTGTRITIRVPSIPGLTKGGLAI